MMTPRFVYIWFRYLKTDWLLRRNPSWAEAPFVLHAFNQNRMVVIAANRLAEREGVYPGTILADAKAMIPGLRSLEDNFSEFDGLLTNIAKWCIRYSPIVATDAPDGILVDATGCSHLWGGEASYLKHISEKLKQLGYSTRISMAGTPGTAWAVAHFGHNYSIFKNGEEKQALAMLPPQALRIDPEIAGTLHKLGLSVLADIFRIPTPSLRRRFGETFIRQLQLALGYREEILHPVIIPPIYSERLPCFEPVLNAGGIGIALEQLMKVLCSRLKAEEKGLRLASFKAYRTDGKMVSLSIRISRPSNNSPHLVKLFTEKINQLAAEPGIELFTLEAGRVEPLPPSQEKLWDAETGQLQDKTIAELIDRISNKIGEHKINRFLPAEHYWPERSIQPASSLEEKPACSWNASTVRPLRILLHPQPILVAAPIPDYPPMHFRHKGRLHKIAKADGPERIEQEWWLQGGEHRDYYYVEDEDGNRYWLFRSGHYEPGKKDQWFLHGYCA